MFDRAREERPNKYGKHEVPQYSGAKSRNSTGVSSSSPEEASRISQEPEAETETEWIIFPFLVLVGSTVHAEKRYHVLLKNQTIGKQLFNKCSIKNVDIENNRRKKQLQLLIGFLFWLFLVCFVYLGK